MKRPKKRSFDRQALSNANLHEHLADVKSYWDACDVSAIVPQYDVDWLIGTLENMLKLQLAHVEPVFKMREGRPVKELWLVKTHNKFGSRDCAALGGACLMEAFANARPDPKEANMRGALLK